MAMSDQKLLEIIEKYESMLSKLDFVARPERANPELRGTDMSLGARLRHLLWMLGEMRTFLKEGRREKLMRWLGFVQGAFWCDGIASVDSSKRDNMPDEAKSEEA